MRERRGEEGRAVWLSIYLHDCFIDLGLSYRSGDPFTPARVRERPVDEGLFVEKQLLFSAVIVNLPCAFKAVALVGHGGEDGDETTLLHLHTYTVAIRHRILLVPDTRGRRQGDDRETKGGETTEKTGIVGVSRVSFTRSGEPRGPKLTLSPAFALTTSSLTLRDCPRNCL